MTVIRGLILNHFFIRCLREYIGRNADLDVTLHIFEGIELNGTISGEEQSLRPSNLIFLLLNCSSLI